MRKEGAWDWFDNPFVDGRELNGLRVMMSLLNNWDLSEGTIRLSKEAVSAGIWSPTSGATFGNTGNSLTRSKSVPEDYAESTFVEKTTPGFVDFVMHSRPFFLSAVNVPNYRDRTRMEQVTKHIPRADAEWLGRRLSRLSGEQIRDAFRAGWLHQRGGRAVHAFDAQADRRTGRPVKLIIEPEAGVGPLLAAIARAKKSVEIAIFRFDRRDIEIALKAAAARSASA